MMATQPFKYAEEDEETTTTEMPVANESVKQPHEVRTPVKRGWVFRKEIRRRNNCDENHFTRRIRFFIRLNAGFNFTEEKMLVT